jgi:signal transduction histidine kinase
LSAASYKAGKAERRGIGLLLVKALLEKFNGTIWIEDRVPGDYHKGSRFLVLLPAAK